MLTKTHFTLALSQISTKPWGPLVFQLVRSHYTVVLLVLPGLPTRALGSLQGIQLHHLLASRLDVGGEVAGAIFPLNFRIGAGLAIFALW